MLLRRKSRKSNQSDIIVKKSKETDKKSRDGDATRSPLCGLRSLSCSLPPRDKITTSKEYENTRSDSFDAGLKKIPEVMTCNGKMKEALSSVEIGSLCNNPPVSNIPSIGLDNSSGYLESPGLTTGSPTFKIEDYTSRDHNGSPKISTPIFAMHPYRKNDFVSITELSESPKRYGFHSNHCVDDDVDGFMTNAPHDVVMSASMMGLVGVDKNHVTLNPPNSPLLLAVRTAVDSLNQYEDFDILEEIGSGFFADVFKVG